MRNEEKKVTYDWKGFIKYWYFNPKNIVTWINWIYHIIVFPVAEIFSSSDYEKVTASSYLNSMLFGIAFAWIIWIIIMILKPFISRKNELQIEDEHNKHSYIKENWQPELKFWETQKGTKEFIEQMAMVVVVALISCYKSFSILRLIYNILLLGYGGWLWNLIIDYIIKFNEKYAVK